MMFYKLYDWLWNFNDSALAPEVEIFLRKEKRKFVTMASTVNLSMIALTVFTLIFMLSR